MGNGELGDFLRAQRRAGGSRDGRAACAWDRRVAGLRREEVAVLAVVSADYYTEELDAAVVEAYPDRGNRGVLWTSARALKPLA